MAHGCAIVCQNYLFFLQEVVRFNCQYTDNGFFFECAQERQQCFLGWTVWWGVSSASISKWTCFCLVKPACTSVLHSPGPLKTQSRKWVTEHGFLSLCPPPGVYYASLKKCHRELVGREKCIPNHYCTHLFSGDNLPSSFNKKIEVNGWKILHYLSSQNSPLSWLILMSSVHLRDGSKD